MLVHCLPVCQVTRFRFKLQLTLRFLPNSVEEIVSCDQHVIDYEFQTCSRQAKDEGKAALKTLCLPHLECEWRPMALNRYKKPVLLRMCIRLACIS